MLDIEGNVVMNELAGALEKFLEKYQSHEKLLEDMKEWSCNLKLHASDSDEVIDLQIRDGYPQKVSSMEETDLLVTSNSKILVDILETKTDPNEPYMFGELVVKGAEKHFVLLDYVVTKLCQK